MQSLKKRPLSQCAYGKQRPSQTSLDPDGAMLGSDCVLVRRTTEGYRCISRGEAAALQAFLFADGMEADWLFGQCRRISEAFDGGEIALAQIFGLRIPIDDLDGGSLKRLATAAPFIKANFNPDEPRIPAGQPGGGEWTTGGAVDTPTPVPSVTETGEAAPERGGEAEPSSIPAQVTIPWDVPAGIPWANLLSDLQALAAEDGGQADFSRRIASIRAWHGKKGKFVERLTKLGGNSDDETLYR